MSVESPSCGETSRQWSRSFGSLRSDSINGVAVDTVGNIFVTGSFVGQVDFGGGLRTADETDAFVVSYSRDGSYRWDLTVQDEGSAIAVGPDGGVVVAGYFDRRADFGGGERMGSTESGFLASYGPDGSHRWDHTFGYIPESSRTRAETVAVGSDGTVYVSGTFNDTIDFGGGSRTATGFQDAFVASYAPDGTYRWDRRFGSDGASIAFARGLAVDSDGSVVVTGMFGRMVDLGGGIRGGIGTSGFIARYASSGAHRWDRVFAEQLVDGRDVALDSTGNLYVVGRYATPADFGGGVRTPVASTDSFVASYTSDGAYRWDVTFGGEGDGDGDAALACAVTAAGSIVVAGSYLGPTDFGGGERQYVPSESSIFVASYRSDGEYRWDRVVNTGSGFYPSAARGIAVTPAGAIIVGGSYAGGFLLEGEVLHESEGFPDAFLLSLECGCP